MIRRLAATLAALSLVAILAAPVLAGAWAEVRIDPFEVGSTVLNHGKTPRAG